MIDGYNFSNVSDLRHFISILLDDYCPDQLSKIDSDLVYDAVKDLQDNKIKMTGNSLYAMAVSFGIYETDNQIINWKNYIDETELTKEQITILDNFAEQTKICGLLDNGIIEYFANGSLDSSVYISPSISTDDKEALKIINEYSDIIKDLSEKISLDISCLEYQYENVYEKDITDDY